jgi:hypothetical protein
MLPEGLKERLISLPARSLLEQEIRSGDST